MNIWFQAKATKIDSRSGQKLLTTFGDGKYPMPVTSKQWIALTDEATAEANAFKTMADERFKSAKVGAISRLKMMRDSLEEPAWTEYGKKAMDAFFLTTTLTMRNALRANLEKIQDCVAGFSLHYALENQFSISDWAEIANRDDPQKLMRLNYRFFAQANSDGFVFSASSPWAPWEVGVNIVAGIPDYIAPSTPLTGVKAEKPHLSSVSSKSFFCLPYARSIKYFSLASVLIHEATHRAMSGPPKDIIYNIPYKIVGNPDTIFFPLNDWPLVAAAYVEQLEYLKETAEMVAKPGAGAAQVSKELVSDDMLMLGRGRSPDKRWLNRWDLPISRPLILSLWADYVYAVTPKSMTPVGKP